MKSTIFIRYLCILLLFTAWQSCRKEDGPDKQDDGIRIENLDTRLRIAVPDSLDPECRGFMACQYRKHTGILPTV